MQEALLREISESYLLPFFSGAKIGAASILSDSRDKTVSFINPQVIGFKVDKTDNYRIQFKREQSFAQKDTPAREDNVIKAFTEILGDMSNELTGPLKGDLLSIFQRRVVARAVADEDSEAAVLAVIDQLSAWATRLYEGAPISSAIGILPETAPDLTLTLSDFASHDFGAVLSNGFDTLLEFSQDLKFVRHAVVGIDDAIAVSYCPWRNTAIAQWTMIEPRRIAIVLNRLGEILIFRQGQLLFARRSGTWHFLTHEPIIRQMHIPRDQAVRKAVYETALDASFSRTGACIGVVSSDLSTEIARVVTQADLIETDGSAKTAAIRQIIAGRNFQDLPRTLRQELVAIDGSTVISHTGKVIAVGAILKINGGSTSGGRTAAANRLSEIGLGVKVSQDGSILGFLHKKKSGPTTFRVM